MNYFRFWNQINLSNKKGNIIDVYNFLKLLTINKVINSFLLRLSFFISKIFNVYIHWGYPESVSIEPTNICNLSCTECASGNNSMNRKRLFISLDNYKKDINQLKKHLVHLQLFFQGEPFMHSNIFDMILYATDKHIYTSISTNGHFLSLSNCKKIVDSKLHCITISVDGTTQDSYEKYRVGGDLNTVLTGISHLVNEKQRLKSKTPFIIMQFIVFRNNEHQINDIKQLAKQLKVDSLKIKTAQIDNYKYGNDLIPQNNKYSRYKREGDIYVINKRKNYKCKRIWFGLVISAENNLLPCCFDKDAKYQFNSNIISNNNTIIKNWNGDKIKHFRKVVWSKDNFIPICENCTEGLKH